VDDGEEVGGKRDSFVDVEGEVGEGAEEAPQEQPPAPSTPVPIAPPPAPETPQPRVNLQTEVALARGKAKAWLATLGDKIGGSSKKEPKGGEGAGAAPASPAPLQATPAPPVPTMALGGGGGLVLPEVPAADRWFGEGERVHFEKLFSSPLHADAVTGAAAAKGAQPPQLN
jgi:hypothetical protein